MRGRSREQLEVKGPLRYPVLAWLGVASAGFLAAFAIQGPGVAGAQGTISAPTVTAGVPGVTSATIAPPAVTTPAATLPVVAPPAPTAPGPTTPPVPPPAVQPVPTPVAPVTTSAAPKPGVPKPPEAKVTTRAAATPTASRPPAGSPAAATPTARSGASAPAVTGGATPGGEGTYGSVAAGAEAPSSPRGDAGDRSRRGTFSSLPREIGLSAASGQETRPMWRRRLVLHSVSRGPLLFSVRPRATPCREVIATARRPARPGANEFRFARRFGETTLRPGTYALAVRRPGAAPLLAGLIRVPAAGPVRVRPRAELLPLGCPVPANVATVPWTRSSRIAASGVPPPSAHATPTSGVAGVQASIGVPRDARPSLTPSRPFPPHIGGYSLLTILLAAVSLGLVTAILAAGAAMLARARTDRPASL